MKHCGGKECVKNGMVYGRQRYRCKACGYNFTNSPRRGKPAAMKALAVLLYAMGNASFCMIARISGVDDVAVLKGRIRAQAEAIPEPQVSGDLWVPTLDEMWHFIQKNKKTLDLASL
ncbi:MAG: IS1/IS1595 family N-terminal zinc-binding domain-containing protein [Methylococcales bacterium]